MADYTLMAGNLTTDEEFENLTLGQNLLKNVKGSWGPTTISTATVTTPELPDESTVFVLELHGTYGWARVRTPPDDTDALTPASATPDQFWCGDGVPVVIPAKPGDEISIAVTSVS